MANPNRQQPQKDGATKNPEGGGNTSTPTGPNRNRDRETRTRPKGDMSTYGGGTRPEPQAPPAPQAPQAPTISLMQQEAPPTDTEQQPAVVTMPAQEVSAPGVSGGPSRRDRFLDLYYPSEFYPDRVRFDEVFRYAAKNPYTYAHPVYQKPGMINIVSNRKSVFP